MQVVLCFGDSLTWGYNPSTKMRYDYDDRYPEILEKLLNEKNPHIPHRVINDGLCGRTTVFEDKFMRNMSSVNALEISLEVNQPNIVILMLGTNDLKSYICGSPNEIAQGCLKLIQIIKKFNDKIKICLVVPPKISYCKDSPMNLFFGDAECVSLEPYYRKIIQFFSVTMIDSNSFITASHEDGVHMTKESNILLAKKITDFISDLY